MILISHRGNINGKFESYENEPNYIKKALDNGYDVEVDLWIKDREMFLGHDEPQYGIILSDFWLQQKNRIWWHCKNIEALEFCKDMGKYRIPNFFWHQEDDYTITSNGFIWVYPGKKLNKYSIAVMPELNNDNIKGCFGVCSDYIEKYKQI